MQKSDLTGILLAGGRSSRMGTEKGFVLFKDKKLIQYGIDLLSIYSNRILISSSNIIYEQFGKELIADEVTGLGPAAGLATAFKNSETTWNLVLACDLPFLECELIDALLANAETFQAVIPLHQGKLEPLAGLYRTDLQENFRNALASGNLAMHKILHSLNVLYLNTDLLCKKYPNLFTNFNTLKEMECFHHLR